MYLESPKLNPHDLSRIRRAEVAAKKAADQLRVVCIPPIRPALTVQSSPNDYHVSFPRDVDVYHHELGYVLKKGQEFLILGCEDATLPSSMFDQTKLRPILNDETVRFGCLDGKLDGSYCIKVKRIDLN